MGRSGRKARVLAYVVFASEGGNGERFFSECLRRSFSVTDIKATACGFEAKIPAKQYLQLHKTAHTAGCRLRVVKKYGLWFRLRPLQRHTGAAVGILAALLFVMCGRSMIWNIEYYGVGAAAQQELSDRLFACGVYQGAAASDEKLRRAENLIMMQTEEYSAVALNFTKGKLVVEATAAVKQPTMYLPQDWDIRASHTGVVRSVEVYSGTSDVQIGQLVQKGDVLVRATWQDQENKLQPSPCRAKIMAYVEKTYASMCPLELTQEVVTDTKTESLSLLIGEKMFWLKKGEKTAPSSQQGLRVLGLSLPVTICRTVCTVTQERTQALTEEEAKRRCIQALDAVIYEELSDAEVLSREYEYQITPQRVTVTLRLRAYADIAAERSTAEANTGNNG